MPSIIFPSRYASSLPKNSNANPRGARDQPFDPVTVTPPTVLAALPGRFFLVVVLFAVVLIRALFSGGGRRRRELPRSPLPPGAKDPRRTFTRDATGRLGNAAWLEVASPPNDQPPSVSPPEIAPSPATPTHSHPVPHPAPHADAAPAHHSPAESAFHHPPSPPMDASVNQAPCFDSGAGFSSGGDTGSPGGG